MPDDTSCSRCGVTIQATTAERTDGLCIPCKRGTRESIEASKQWYRDERELEATDPFRILWKTLDAFSRPVKRSRATQKWVALKDAAGRPQWERTEGVEDDA